MSQILHLLRFAQPVATALTTIMKRPPQKLCALIGLPLAVALSSCQPCATIGCPPGLSVSIGMTNADALPEGIYELQLNVGEKTRVGRCQLTSSAVGCLLSMPAAEATYDGQRINFSFWGQTFTGEVFPFILLVDGGNRKAGNLRARYAISQPNGPQCGDCAAGSAVVDLP